MQQVDVRIVRRNEVPHQTGRMTTAIPPDGDSLCTAEALADLQVDPLPGLQSGEIVNRQRRFGHNLLRAAICCISAAGRSEAPIVE